MNDQGYIYRIVDILDLVNMLETKTLRFGSARHMNDKNELFGAALSHAQDPLFRSWSKLDNTALQEAHANLARGVYISSWTSVHDNIAVWAMYSPTKRGVEIRTTLDKLKNAVLHFEKTRHVMTAYRHSPGSPARYVFNTQVGAVRYLNFIDKVNEINTRIVAYREELKSSHNVEAVDIKTLWEKYFRDSELDPFKAYLTKDNRYSHEQEIRAATKLVKRDLRPAVEVPIMDLPICELVEDELPPNIYIPVDDEFFDEIHIDGRAQDWEIKAIAAILTKYNIRAKVSTAFSHITESCNCEVSEF